MYINQWTAIVRLYPDSINKKHHFSLFLLSSLKGCGNSSVWTRRFLSASTGTSTQGKWKERKASGKEKKRHLQISYCFDPNWSENVKTATQTGIVPFTVTAADPARSLSFELRDHMGYVVVDEGWFGQPHLWLNRFHQLKMLQRYNRP